MSAQLASKRARVVDCLLHSDTPVLMSVIARRTAMSTREAGQTLAKLHQGGFVSRAKDKASISGCYWYSIDRAGYERWHNRSTAGARRAQQPSPWLVHASAVRVVA